MKPIFLIGYMACGKTTLGRAVAKAAALGFVDLDTYIENRFHSTVNQIFSDHGEEGFRRRERAMLEEVSEFEDTVVACGGGTPCFFNNMELMNERGTTVWLNTPAERIFERLCRNRLRRPLLADKSEDELMDFITAAMEQRRPHYEKAAHRFNGHDLEDRRQIELTTQSFITRFING